MAGTSRRTFLKVLAGGAAAGVVGVPVFRALAGNPPDAESEFFIFIHAAGAWDVTVWSDPRNEAQGLIDPATTDAVDTAGLSRWRDRPIGGGKVSFQLVRPSGSNITFGPAIGELADLYDRLCLINGIAMNTVSHPDGTAFSATGRHLAGGRTVAASVDTMMANEFGRGQLFPVVSVQFPSSFTGPNLRPEAQPLRVGSIGGVARSLTRSRAFDTAEERDAVTALLSREASDLAEQAYYPEAYEGLAQQYESLRRMLGGDTQEVLNAARLRQLHPEFAYNAAFQGEVAVNAAFAVEAMKRNLVRCVSFKSSFLDTHNANYEDHPRMLQELFDVIATLVRKLDATPHPTRTGRTLGDHTHILVVSEFCRTPQINIAGGRDHYPNNSALVISPRFRGNFVHGRSDPGQLLPVAVRRFADGMRPIAPPDILATFLHAFGVEPRRYLRDGEVVPELLRS